VSQAWLRAGVLALVLVSGAAAQVVPGGRPVSPRRGLPTPDDTVRMLAGRPFTFDAFFAQVLRNHPVVRQASLIETGADGDVTSAYGNFEPKLEASWDAKRATGITSGSNSLYYNYADIGIKIPTPFGPDFKVGYERSTGININPQRNTQGTGLFYAGFVLPLGQNLLTDARRNQLRVARALRDVAQAERQAMTNKLLFSAAKSYATWYESALQLQVIREGVRLADVRYTATLRRVVAGDAAGIDSIEAAAELNRRRSQLQGAEQNYFAATMDMNSYLWDLRGQARDLAPDEVPSDSGLGQVRLDSAAVPGILARVLEVHPDVRKADGKVDQTAADRFLAQQAVIPFAQAELAALAPQGGSLDVGQAINRDANFKGSLTISSPLLFFKERGKLQSTDAKADRAVLERTQARRDVTLLVRTAINDLSQFEAQLRLQREAVRLFRILAEGERAKFDAGDSNLFLVNTRERSVLDEELKLVSLQAKYAAARAALAVAAGAPGQLPELQ
jgi:outer membrane protein TolC